MRFGSGHSGIPAYSVPLLFPRGSNGEQVSGVIIPRSGGLVYIQKPIGGDQGKLKEIKVRIPVDHHWRLHAMKLTCGVSISELVRDALGGYFDETFEAMAAGQRDI